MKEGKREKERERERKRKPEGREAKKKREAETGIEPSLTLSGLAVPTFTPTQPGDHGR